MRDRWVLKLSAMGLALALIGGAAHAQAPKAEPGTTATFSSISSRSANVSESMPVTATDGKA